MTVGGNAVKCPDCNSTEVVKKGKDRKGRQRYRCKNCGRYFTLIDAIEQNSPTPTGDKNLNSNEIEVRVKDILDSILSQVPKEKLKFLDRDIIFQLECEGIKTRARRMDNVILEIARKVEEDKTIKIPDYGLYYITTYFEPSRSGKTTKAFFEIWWDNKKKKAVAMVSYYDEKVMDIREAIKTGFNAFNLIKRRYIENEG